MSESLITITRDETNYVVFTTEKAICSSPTVKDCKALLLKSIAQQVAINIFHDGVLALTGMGLENAVNGLRPDAQEFIKYYLLLQDELLRIPDDLEV